MSFAEGTPTVTVELAGKPRQLGFTLGAMKRCRDLGVLSVDTSDQTAMMLALPEYVWACMDGDDRAELTVEAVGEIMHPQNLKPIAEAITELFAVSQPEDDVGNAVPAAAKKPTAGKKRTSTNSGQSAPTT